MAKSPLLPSGRKLQHVLAIGLGVYFLVLVCYLGLLLVAVWLDLKLARIVFPLTWFADPDTVLIPSLGDPTFRLFFYTAMGGALGSLLESSLDLHKHYAGKRDLNGRFLGKYFLGPWMAGVLAILSYAVIRSGIAVIGGTSAGSSTDLSAMISAFALGGLIGFNSRQVSKWLYAQGKRLFPTDELCLPDLAGKTFQQAETELKQLGLKASWDTAKFSAASVVGSTKPAKNSIVQPGQKIQLLP